MSDLQLAFDAIRTAEEQGRRFCAEMDIEQKTALVPCWALREALLFYRQQTCSHWWRFEQSASGNESHTVCTECGMEK